MASKIRRDDEVIVLAGKDKGKTGKVTKVLVEDSKVFVEGINLIKKHVRKSQQYPEGAILEREGTVHASNVMLAENFDARAAKHGQKSE